MIPAPISADVEEDASTPDRQHEVAKNHSPEAPVGNPVNGRFETAIKARRNLLMSSCQKNLTRDVGIMSKPKAIGRDRVKRAAM